MTENEIEALDKKIEATERKQTKAAREEAARSLAGMWKNHHDEVTVEETVRMMRRGRQFDT